MAVTARTTIKGTAVVNQVSEDINGMSCKDSMKKDELTSS